MSFAKVTSILLSLSMATFIFAIEETIVATSVSAIGSAIEVKGSLAWISTGYLITQTALQPIVGRVADIVGVKRLLVIVIWIFIAGSLIAGLSNSIELLVAGRMISGVGAAGILSLVIIIISSAMVIPFTLMAALSSIFVSHNMTRWNHPRLSYHLPLLLLPVGLGLLSTLTEISHLGQVAGYSILAGLGFGSGTQITMVIAQNNLPLDILPTTTALISTAPALGGVLGVGITGTVINNMFAKALHGSSFPISSWDGLNLNDVVSVLDHFPQGSPIRDLVVKAYVSAFQKGMYFLVAAAVFQIVISLPLRKVVLDEGVKEKAKRSHATGIRGEEGPNQSSEPEKQRVTAERDGENV